MAKGTQIARGVAGLALFGALTAGAALVGGRYSGRGSRSVWYRLLRKPRFQPPEKAYGPVWAGLYALMAASAWLVVRSRGPAKGRALALWGSQLALNVGWSYLFFGKHRARAALVDLGLMFLLIGAYALTARKADARAAWLMAPYLGWTGFAGALNADIVRRNPRLTNGLGGLLP
jgi:tryptophan-rich sensory protein